MTQIPEHHLPMPFILRFAEQGTFGAPGGGTVYESEYRTGLDNKFETDYADDEDDANEIPAQTGLLADSGTEDDEE